MNKVLTIFYSKTGTTKKIALELKEKLQCDVEEIKELKERKGVIGFIKSAYDALTKKLTEIAPIEKDPANYDIIILSTPVWAGKMVPAVRTYINQNRNKFKNVCFLCTYLSGGVENAFKDMKRSAGKPILTLGITHGEIKKGNYLPKINKFVEKLL